MSKRNMVRMLIVSILAMAGTFGAVRLPGDSNKPKSAEAVVADSTSTTSTTSPANADVASSN